MKRFCSSTQTNEWTRAANELAVSPKWWKEKKRNIGLTCSLDACMTCCSASVFDSVLDVWIKRYRLSLKSEVRCVFTVPRGLQTPWHPNMFLWETQSCSYRCPDVSQFLSSSFSFEFSSFLSLISSFLKPTAQRKSGHCSVTNVLIIIVKQIITFELFIAEFISP